jgi:putative Mg2+ transporter-C (MgtC) family protein
VRTYHLLFITVEECDLSRRLIASAVFGGIIGWERRSLDRPACIRTMSLVSLGSCFFTICSMLAFKSSTMEWDSSRVAAAIPSGVGFLGAGLIWKGSIGGGGGNDGEGEIHQVHGLTTAASLWLAASMGVGAGGGMFFTALYSVVLLIFIRRFGPTLIEQIEFDDGIHDENLDAEEVSFCGDPRADFTKTEHTAGTLQSRRSVKTLNSLSSKRHLIPTYGS